MLDYWKLWIYDNTTIKTVLNNNNVVQHFTSNEDGVLKGITGKYQYWKIQTHSLNCLEIAGSIHKFWNKGTNENDFSFSSAVGAIKSFCNEFNLAPSLAFVKNLEFGVNLQLQINASEIIDQIICFNNLQPIRPYNIKANCHFIEFEQWDYYLKVYDKGKQYKTRLPNTANTLRIEVKGMNSRFLMSSKIETLADLLVTDNLQVLALKFAKIVKGIVFDDDTINVKELTVKERKLYRELSNPRKWKQYRGNATSTFRSRVNKFRELVENKGTRKIYSTISKAINSKILELSKNDDLANFLPNTYTRKTAKNRVCLTCGKDISNQHQNSKFCSSKFAGERNAKRCRNSNSNPRNNLNRKIKKIESKGVLFDITPFITRVKTKNLLFIE